MAITKMHQPLRNRLGGGTTTLNVLDKEGQLQMFEQKVIDKNGDIVHKYFAKLLRTNETWEITPVAYKSRTE